MINLEADKYLHGRNSFSISRWIAVLLIFVLVIINPRQIFANTTGQMLDFGRFSDFAHEIGKYPHRLAGSDNAKAAANLIESKLRENGVTRIQRQIVPTVSSVLDRCDLVRDSGEVISLLPLRENSLMLPITPSEGLKGLLVHGIEELKTDESYASAVQIVVLPVEEAGNWKAAFARGASAVIIYGSFAEVTDEQLWIHAPINLPRFYFQGSVSELPIGETVTLHSQMRWEQQESMNIVAKVGPSTPDSNKDAIVLSVNYDTFGLIPLLSPGGLQAWNVSGLVEIAAYLETQSLDREIYLIFFGGDASGLSGANAFYASFADSEALERLNQAREDWLRESDFLNMLQVALQSFPSEDIPTEIRRALLLRFKILAFAEQRGLQDQLSELRLSSRKLGKSLDNKKIKQIERERQVWSEFLRGMDVGEWSSLDPILLNRLKNQTQLEIEARKGELGGEKRIFESSENMAAMMGEASVAFHLSLKFDDQEDRWGFFFGGDSGWHSPYDLPGLYGRVQGALHQSILPLLQEDEFPLFVEETINGQIAAGRRLSAGGPMIHSGEVAGSFGIYNFVAGTLLSDPPMRGYPEDEVSFYNGEIIAKQLESFLRVIEVIAGSSELNLREVIRPSFRAVTRGFDLSLRATGPQVWVRNLGRVIANRPIPGAVIELNAHAVHEEGDDVLPSLTDYSDHRLVMSNQNGSYTIPGTFLEEGMDFALACVFDELGQLKMVSTQESILEGHARLSLINARGGWQSTVANLTEGKVMLMAGRSNSLLEAKRSFSGNRDGFLFWYVSPEVDEVKVFSVDRGVKLSSIEGAGFEPVFSSRNSAEDLWSLNEERLALLRRSGIGQSSVEKLHEEVREQLVAARSSSNNSLKDSLFRFGFWKQKVVYEHIMGVLNDLVLAVLFLLLLTLPFAYALERLLIGSTIIHKQIIGFIGIFLICFVGFYFTHPAFKLSSAPLIIFLGFAILVMSSIVISVLSTRFEVEIRKLQGVGISEHNGDVSRMGTFLMAMHIGISTMRRRPMRTFLSILTISLLTFAILTIASLGSEPGTIKRYIQPLPDYTAASLSRNDKAELPENLQDTLSERWPGYAVSANYWLAQETFGGETWPVSDINLNTITALRGILGIEMSEWANRKDFQKLFNLAPSGFDQSIWLSDGLARRLGVQVGERINLAGNKLEVGAILKVEDFYTLVGLSGVSILPADFTNISEENNARASGTVETPSPKEPLPVDSIAIVPAKVAKLMGATVRSINVYTDSIQSAEEVASELSRAFRTAVPGTRADGVFWHQAGIVVSASGFSVLFVPIILGGLVVFGTLLGSVVDRDREVYTLSALGLTPLHVGLLFLAESLIYAIVGTVSGFLITQGVVSVLGLFERLYGWPIPDFNFSSINAVTSLIILIIIVLLAAIYPAYRASKGSNPGLMRKWRMPTAKGDVLNMILPFTLTSGDFQSVVGFLYEHFENCRDSSLGSFMAWDTSVESSERGRLKSCLALTPYDLGVTQKFVMESRPSQIEGIDEIEIVIQRESGQPDNWWRLNKRLIHDLRRQILLWRSLPTDRVEHYRRLSDQASTQEKELERNDV